jgi:hypothetical protein
MQRWSSIVALHLAVERESGKPFLTAILGEFRM